MNKLQKIVLLLLIVSGILFRITNFNTVPATLYVDEVAMYIDAASVAKTGADMHGNHWSQTIYPSYGDYKQSGYIWLISAAMKVFGVSEWVVRLPSLLAGIGTVFVAGGLGYVVFEGKRSKRLSIAVCCAAVVAISPWSILFSRVGFEGHLGQFLLSASVFFYLLSRKQYRWMLLAVIFGALSTYSYFSVRFVLPVLFIAQYTLLIAPTHIRSNFSLSRILKQLVLLLLLPLAAYGILLLPLFNSPHYQDANRYRLNTSSILTSDQHILDSNSLRETVGDTLISRVIFHRDYLLLRNLLKNYSDNLSLQYLFVTGDPNLRHGTGSHGVFLFGLFPFLIVGGYGLVKLHKRILIFLIIWWLVALLPASVPETTPHTLRSLNAYVAVSLIIGYGVWYFFNASVGMLRYKKYRLLYGLVGSTLVGLVVFSYLHLAHYYFVIYPKISSDYWFANSREEAIIANRMKKNKPIYSVRVGDKYYLWLLAYSEFLGTTIPDKQYSGFTITSTPVFKNDVGIVDLPQDGNAIIIVSDENLANEVKVLYKDKIVDVQTVVNILGKTTYIFDVS